jgi:hypothetical protein
MPTALGYESGMATQAHNPGHYVPVIQRDVIAQFHSLRPIRFPILLKFEIHQEAGQGASLLRLSLELMSEVLIEIADVSDRGLDVCRKGLAFPLSPVGTSMPPLNRRKWPQALDRVSRESGPY